MSNTRGEVNVCLIIPAYNEALVIGEVIHSLRLCLDKTDFKYEIVVIDDGSKDDTAREATKAGATVVQHILNRGAGGATSTGLRYAEKYRFDVAVTLDGDGQHSSDDVVYCLEEAIRKKSDLLIGSRLINPAGMSHIKIIGNKGLSTITRLLSGVRITDSQSGLRVFSKKALEVLEWKSTSYDFCSEMILRAKQMKLSIHEAPIKAIYTDYSIAKGQNNWNGINIIKSLIRHRIIEIFE